MKVLDPTSERETAALPRAERPPSLERRTIGLLDISKPRGDVFLDRLEARCTEQGWVASVRGVWAVAGARRNDVF